MKVEEEDEGDIKKENAKSSVSTKRSRAAAIHNQSERVSLFFPLKNIDGNLFLCGLIISLLLFNLFIEKER